MDTIRCPSCKRWLALPEEEWAQAAQCPGCRTVFTPQAESIKVGDGIRDERFQALATGAGDDERIRAHPPAAARKNRRRRPNRSALGWEIGRAEKIAFWAGFFAGAGVQLAIGIAQADFSEIFTAPIFGVLTGFLFVVFQNFLRHVPPSGRLILLGMFVLGSGGLLPVPLLHLSQWSVTSVLAIVAVSCVGGGLLALWGFFVLSLLFQVARLPRLLAFWAEPDRVQGRAIPREEMPSRENTVDSIQDADK